MIPSVITYWFSKIGSIPTWCIIICSVIRTNDYIIIFNINDDSSRTTTFFVHYLSTSSIINFKITFYCSIIYGSSVDIIRVT
mmetsp:Transcript_1336/g.2320  ORF Transcript_1336/g.2320 Transcript_1336/m.2320 type:complete len:82 (-) Transcript_1336:215-460(-)